jgi:ATP-dependent RNA helicase RhlE
MLDMGFQDDINKIIKTLPAKRQNLLFSATMPGKIRQLAKKILHDPVEVNIALAKPPEKIVQKAFVVYEPQKLPLIKKLLKEIKYKNALIFCGRKQTVKQLTRELKHGGINVSEIHSDLEQAVRESTLSAFAGGRIPVLVATDILSRGIDIDTIDVVINYDVPGDGEDYVHRIGRTARAEAEGAAFTLIGEKEQGKFAAIEQLLGKEVEKAEVPKEFGPAPSYHPRTRSGSKGPQRKFHRGAPKRR